MARGNDKPGFRVQFARTQKDRDAVFRFRYRVFVEELGRDMPGTDHDNKMMIGDLDQSGLLVALRYDDDIVATVRMNRGHPKGIWPAMMADNYKITPFMDAFPLNELTFTSRLLIHPKFAGTKAMAVLLAAIYKLGRQQGSQFDFTSCEPYMVKAFERLGYRRYTGNFVDASAGYQIPLVLLMKDIDYLREIGSPLARLAAFYPNDRNSRQWFSRELPDYAARPPEHAMSEEQYWQFLTEKLQQTPLIGIPLLKGLTFQEAKKFVNAGTVITVGEGDTVIRAGEMGDCMFVILSGSLNVQAPADMGGRAFTALGGGDIFGELAFLRETPRSADVVASEPSEVLVLTQAFFRDVMERIPRIAMKVLYNMSIILAQRLHASTDDLLVAMRAEPAAAAEIDKIEPTDTIADRYGVFDAHDYDA